MAFRINNPTTFGTFYTATNFGEDRIGIDYWKDCWKIKHIEAISYWHQLIEAGASVTLPDGTVFTGDHYKVHFDVWLDKKCDCIERPQLPDEIYDALEPPTDTTTDAEGNIHLNIWSVLKECEDCDRYEGEHGGLVQPCEPSFPRTNVIQYAMDLYVRRGSDVAHDANGPSIAALLSTELTDPTGPMGDWLNDTGVAGADAMGYVESCCPPRLGTRSI